MLSGYPGPGRHVGLLFSASSLQSWRETRPNLEPMEGKRLVSSWVEGSPEQSFWGGAKAPTDKC
jgi:hypothetical protein